MKRVVPSFGGLLLLAMVAAEFAPLAAGRIPFPSEIVLQFGPWEGVRPPVAPSAHGEEGDIATQFYPWRVRNVGSLHRFKIPLWNDSILSGCPMVGNSSSAVFDPVHLAMSWMPARRAWGFGIPLRPLLAGLGAALLVRSLGATAAGAGFAGIAFAFSGFLAAWRGRPQEATGIWLPWILYAVDRMRFRRGAGPVLFAAAMGALPIFGGHPEVTFQMALPVVIFGIHRVFLVPVERRARETARLGAAFAGAVALSLVQLAPAIQWIGHLERSVRVPRPPLPLSELATFLSRDLHGNPNANGIAVPEAAGYAGIATLLLVPLAWWQRNRRDVRLFALFFVMAVSIAFDIPLVRRAVDAVPVLSGIPRARFLLVADLSLAVLAGLGLSVLQESNGGDRLRIAGCVLSASIALALCLRFFVVRPPVGTVLWIAASTLAILVAAFRRSDARASGILLTSILAVDLFSFQHRAIPFDDANTVFPPAPPLTFLREKAADGARVASLDVAMGANFEMMYGLRTPAGYDYRLRRTARILEALGSPSEARNTLTATDVGSSRPHGLFDLSGARYLLVSSAAVEPLERHPDRFRPIYRRGPIEIFENVTALPRAFYMPSSAVRTIPTEEEEASVVLSPSFEASRIVVLSGPRKPERRAPFHGIPVAATEWREGDGSLSFSVEAPGPGVVVVTQSAYPGWHARVDGEPAEVVRADYAFQGVLVGAGRHRVRFRYRPWLFWTSFGISLGGWSSVAGIAVVGALRRRRTFLGEIRNAVSQGA